MNYPREFLPGSVPILGAPFTVKSYVIIVQIVCACGKHEPLMIPFGQSVSCPACFRVFTLAGFRMEGDRPNFQIGYTDPPRATKPNGEDS